MARTLFGPVVDPIFDEVAHESVWGWLDGFVLRPHPELRREGAVCPFVGPAIHQHTLVFRERDLDRPLGRASVVAGLRATVAEFRRTAWAGHNQTLQAMLVLLPRLTDEEALLLDDGHAAIKDELVEQEIMMAPFHPLCRETATRNPHLFAFRSPVPMVAIRNMAFHDIFFLTEKRAWFRRYSRRFGARYRRPERLDPLMVEHYRAAVRHYGEG
ncbi:DUF6875 domain-containing protein [Micromonospora sp. DT229]|uniref:DUF6875 domain-containing protein n=1 Tax=Micromonospora sp. DT229 TaxID=3393430 RepID=UPI003CF3A9A6